MVCITMPATFLSDKWFVRVTGPHSELRKVNFDWVDLTRCLGVLHVGGRTSKEHAHFLIELGSSIQKQSISVRCKKAFSFMKAFTGNERIAVKPWDGSPRAAQYLYAGRSNPETFISKGFTQEEIESYVAGAATADESWVNMSPRSLSQRGAVTINDLAVELSALMKQYPDDFPSPDYFERVANDAIDVHRRHSKPFCVFSIQKVIDTAMADAGGQHRDKVVASIVQKYFRSFGI